MNAEGVRIGDSVKVTAELDDLNVIRIHSRKLGIRALLTVHVIVNEKKSTQGIVNVKKDSEELLFSQIDMTHMVFHRKDTCRIHKELPLITSKPNIRTIVWDDITLRNPEIRFMDEKIQIRGEFMVFFLYYGEEDHVPIQHVEWEIPFFEEVPCPEASEDMIGHVQVSTGFCQLEVKPDEDGEERLIGMEIILNLDMRGYEEEKMTLLKDIYSTEKLMTPVYTPLQYENLIVKNNAKTKVQKRIPLKGVKGKVLQLIHTDGTVKLDDVEMREDGIYVEGVIIADLLFITDEDSQPLCGMTQMLPFSYLIEAKKIGKDDYFELNAGLEQINSTMLDGEEVEVKVVLSLDMIVFSCQESRIITEITEENLDYEQMKEVPGIGVYIAEKEVPVWNVAKEYFTTVDLICEMNGVEGEMLKAGQRIIVIKKVREVL